MVGIKTNLICSVTEYCITWFVGALDSKAFGKSNGCWFQGQCGAAGKASTVDSFEFDPFGIPRRRNCGVGEAVDGVIYQSEYSDWHHVGAYNRRAVGKYSIESHWSSNLDAGAVNIFELGPDGVPGRRDVVVGIKTNLICSVTEYCITWFVCTLDSKAFG